MTYDALGLTPPGKAHTIIDSGDNTYGGKYVINPSGGLISKGHPLGATGLAQCTGNYRSFNFFVDWASFFFLTVFH